MAFLTSSPLMSPDGFIMTAGMISLEFAIALALASIVIGLGSGYATHVIEKKTHFLKNQTRFAQEAPTQTCGGAGTIPQPQPVQTCGCAGATDRSIKQSPWLLSIGQAFVMNAGTSFGFLQQIKWHALADAVVKIGLKQILFLYAIFVAVGFLINSLVPTSWVLTLFSADNPLAVPFAALIGLPLYVTTEASIPRSLHFLHIGGGDARRVSVRSVFGHYTIKNLPRRHEEERS